VKHGLWEHGKRQAWFDEQSVQLIKQRTIDYTTYFEDEMSQNYVTPLATFAKPSDFDMSLSGVKRKFNIT